MNVLAADLQHYLQQSRGSVLRALDDVSEYDARRPVMPSGTNLLGLVKHLVGVELPRRLSGSPGAVSPPLGRGRIDLGLRRHVGHG